MLNKMKSFGILLQNNILNILQLRSQEEVDADMLGQKLEYLAEQLRLNMLSSKEFAKIPADLRKYKRLCDSIGVRYSMYCDISVIEQLDFKVKEGKKEIAIEQELHRFQEFG